MVSVMSPHRSAACIVNVWSWAHQPGCCVILLGVLHLQMAIALIAVAPVVVLFFLAQKHFIRGIALTGIKG